MAIGRGATSFTIYNVECVQLKAGGGGQSLHSLGTLLNKGCVQSPNQVESWVAKAVLMFIHTFTRIANMTYLSRKYFNRFS